MAAPLRYYAFDAALGTFIAELPFEAFSFNEVRNRPGGWDGDLNLDHPTTTRGNLEPDATIVYADRAGEILWGGWLKIAEAKIEAASASVRVGGEGLWSYYRDGRRSIRSRAGMTYATGDNALEITFADVDVFRIVADLLAHAATFAGDLGFDDVRFHGPGVGGLSGITKTVTYNAWEFKNIGDAVEELAAQSPGFDFAIAYEWSGDTIIRHFDLYAPRRGVNSGAIIFEAGKNIELLKWTIDGSKAANVAVATGAGQGDSLKTSETIALDLVAPAGRYPRLEAVRSYRDEAVDANLDAHAAADLSVYKVPLETAEVEIVEEIDANLSSFGIGDTVRLIVSRGFAQINEDFRVESRKASGNAEGLLELTATLAQEGASLGTA